MGQETFGQALRKVRRARGLTQAQVEQRTSIDQTSISRYERGEWCHPDYVRLLDQVLEARGGLIRAAGLLGEGEPTGTVRDGPSYAMLAGQRPIRPGEVSPTERRSLMSAAGWGAAGLAAGSLAGPDLFHHALELGSVGDDRLDRIERQAEQVAFQARHVPSPATLLVPATRQFNGIAGLLTHPQRTTDRVRLVRAASNLARTIGMIEFGRADVESAREWFYASYSGALDAGDPYLADMAAVGMAIIELYERRPSRAIAIVMQRLDRSPISPTRGTAALHGIAARAHATLGDRSWCHRELDHARTVFDGAPEPTSRSAPRSTRPMSNFSPPTRPGSSGTSIPRPRPRTVASSCSRNQTTSIGSLCASTRPTRCTPEVRKTRRAGSLGTLWPTRTCSSATKSGRGPACSTSGSVTTVPR